MNNQCKFTKSDNNQCQAFAIEGSEYCFSHCPKPEVKQAKHQAVVDGGKSESYKKLELNLEPVLLRDANDVILFLNTVINELRGGQIPPKLASCCGFLVNQLLRAIEIGSLEEKVKTLEKIIEQRKTNTRQLEGKLR